MMDPKIRQAWEDFLDPAVMRPRLISASIFIAAFETLKDAIVGRIRDFFTFGFDEKGAHVDSKYKDDVLCRNRSPTYASLDWLKEQGAINESDLASFERVKSCRNHLAHDLFRVVGSEGLPADFEVALQDMVGLLGKIERWWISNVEIPTNPDFDGEEIDHDGIVPGRLMMLQVLCQVALSPEEQSRVYLEEFKRRLGKEEGA